MWSVSAYVAINTKLDCGSTCTSSQFYNLWLYSEYRSQLKLSVPIPELVKQDIEQYTVVGYKIQTTIVEHYQIKF